MQKKGKIKFAALSFPFGSFRQKKLREPKKAKKIAA
jgi:hypothetical protein